MGSFKTSTKKSIVQLGNAPVGAVRMTEPESGMNSTSPVVALGGPMVKVIPPGTFGSPQAVPALPWALPSGNPFTRKTPGFSEPAGHGVTSDAQEGVCLIRLSVIGPPLSGGVEAFVILMLVARLVLPTMTVDGYVGATPTPIPAPRADEATRERTEATAADAIVTTPVPCCRLEAAPQIAICTRLFLFIWVLLTPYPCHHCQHQELL